MGYYWFLGSYLCGGYISRCLRPLSLAQGFLVGRSGIVIPKIWLMEGRTTNRGMPTTEASKILLASTGPAPIVTMTRSMTPNSRRLTRNRAEVERIASAMLIVDATTDLTLAV